MYLHFFKRFMDFWIALVVLVCTSPILLAVTAWLGHPRPLRTEGRKIHNWLHGWFRRAFFLQERPGKDGKIFRIIKFKTMTDERGADGELLPDEQRLTRVGRFVRSTSIDELPQLINVVKGEMSLIGPRPLLVQYLSLYSPEQMRRHEVRPGISGWAQCHGRNAISWKEKFEYDVWYVDHVSLWTDLLIIIITIRNVLLRKDINQKGNATMEVFNGNN
jgi:lipopolysaccharide/colanic/teichoic acid biosynthesis glycosyltransferase